MNYRINLNPANPLRGPCHDLIGFGALTALGASLPATVAVTDALTGKYMPNGPTNCIADADDELNGPGAKDAAAMKQLMGGDDSALNELMNRHADRLFHYLLRSLQNEEDAADLAQETFVRVYQNRDRFDPQQNFSTWLYAIASNLVRNRYRWRSRHPQVALDALDEAGGADRSTFLKDGHASPAEELQTDELAGTIRKAVAELPEDLRLVIILSEYEDRSNAEIAQILHCTSKAVEMRLYRARHQLRQKLEAVKEEI